MNVNKTKRSSCDCYTPVKLSFNDGLFYCSFVFFFYKNTTSCCYRTVCFVNLINFRSPSRWWLLKVNILICLIQSKFFKISSIIINEYYNAYFTAIIIRYFFVKQINCGLRKDMVKCVRREIAFISYYRMYRCEGAS